MLNKQKINPTRDRDTYKLYSACLKGDVEEAKLLIVNGADVNADNPLSIACLEGHVEIVGLLIANGANVNPTTRNGLTSLYEACLNGHVGVARLLIENGADVNATCDPLYIACLKGHVEIVGLLIANGANVNPTTRNGLTSLYIACLKGHVEVARLLIENGADVNATCDPLYIACLKGHVEVARLLIENGADVNPTKRNGLTSLYEACLNGHVDLARLLIDIILLENPLEKKPNLVENNETLSTYWDSYETRSDSEKLSLKTIIFGENSLFDLIVKNHYKWGIMSRNKNIKEKITQPDFRNEHPIFIRTISKNFGKGLRIEKYLDFFMKHLHFRHGETTANRKSCVLNQDCLENILKNLEEADLKALFKACFSNHKLPRYHPIIVFVAPFLSFFKKHTTSDRKSTIHLSPNMENVADPGSQSTTTASSSYKP